MKNLVATFLLLLTAFAGRAQEKNFIDQPYVEVTGSADTAVTPDEIYLRIFISEGSAKNKTGIEAQEQQLIAALQGIGISTDKDLQSGDAGSEFGTYSLTDTRYSKSKIFMLKATSPLQASLAAERLEALGVSLVSVDRVSHTALEMLQSSMRSKAVANAQKSAAALVKGVAQILGPALHIAEVRNEEALKEAQIQFAKNQAMPPTIFQKIKVAVAVNVKFLMRYNTY